MKKLLLGAVAVIVCTALLLTGCADRSDDFKDEVIEIGFGTGGDPDTSEKIGIKFEHSFYSLDDEIYFTLSFGRLPEIYWGDFGKAGLYWKIDGTTYFIKEFEDDFTEDNFWVDYSYSEGRYIYAYSEELRLPTELFHEGVGTASISFYVTKSGGLDGYISENEYGYGMKTESFGYRKEGNTIKLADYAWQLEDKESN